MKIAKFKHLEYNYEFIGDESNESNEKTKQHLRLTEYAEVEFVHFPAEELIKPHIDSLDKQIKSVQAGAEVEINALKRKKQELLALSAPDGR